MSSDYDEYAKLEARKFNIAAGRHPDAPSGSVAFSDSRGHQPLIHEPKKNPVVYTDENGQNLLFLPGKGIILMRMIYRAYFEPNGAYELPWLAVHK